MMSNGSEGTAVKSSSSTDGAFPEIPPVAFIGAIRLQKSNESVGACVWGDVQ